MANIIDYIKWRGDLEFKNSKFNEIDSLILNRFSYFPLDNIIGNAKMILSSYKHLESENKKMIIATITALLEIVKNNAMEEVHKKAKH